MLSRFGLVLLLALTSACASVQVHVDYDPSADFGKLRTFTWFPRTREPTGDFRVDSPLLDSRIRNAIEHELVARGFEKVVDRDPDFFVSYHFSIEDRLDVRTVNRTYVDRWGYVVSIPETRVNQYQQGTLMIDVADAREKRLVWRGVGTGRLRSSPKPQETTQRVNEAVAEILNRFPPGAAS